MYSRPSSNMTKLATKSPTKLVTKSCPLLLLNSFPSLSGLVYSGLRLIPPPPTTHLEIQDPMIQGA